MQLAQLDRLNHPSTSKFRSQYEHKRKPVIISDGFDCPALKKWSLDYFEKKYSDKQVRLDYYIFDEEQQWDSCELMLPEALELIRSNKDTTKKYHLMQKSIPEEFSELLSEVTLPEYAHKSNQHITNLWIGEAGTISPAHYDFSDNFLTQIVGRKRVRLFAPTETQYIYPHTLDDKLLETASAVHISKVQDTDHLDTKRHPNIDRVCCYEGILNPGDILYMPSGWWHEIKSLDVAISVNFWWKKNLFELSPRQLTDWACSTYFYFKDDDFADTVNKFFDMSNYAHTLDIVEEAISKNLCCVAAVFILHYIDQHDEFDSSRDLLDKARLGCDDFINTTQLLEIVDDLKNATLFQHHHV